MVNVASQLDNAFAFIPLTLIKRIDPSLYYPGFVVYLFLLLAAAFILHSTRGSYEMARAKSYTRVQLVLLAVLFALSVVSLSKVVVFLYSNF